MNDNFKIYLERPYSTYVVPDETTQNELCYVAYHPEISGCMSHGSTPEEALYNLQEATELFISTLLEMNLAIPEPMSTQVRMEISLSQESEISSAANMYISAPFSISDPIFTPVS